LEHRKMKVRNVLTGLALLAAATTAAATVTYTFTANGVTDSVAQQGTALFEFADNGSSLKLTLTDNVDPTSFIASELDGFLFTLSDAPASIVLQSVTPKSVINCNGVVGPTSSCPPGTGTDPYGWGATQNVDDVALGAGFTGNGFAYHPYAIVNESYLAPGGNGGLSNGQHNPLLVGPVEFLFSLTGLTSAPDVTSVTFLFGTNPDSQTGQCAAGTICEPPPCTNGSCGDLNVPEPRTVALLGIALLAAAWSQRRRKLAPR
jgi:PEP-CTERM motif-containing protein